MASVSSTRSSDSYDAERSQVQENHERAMEKSKSDEEKTLTAAKEEYQERLKDLQAEANAEVRKLKEDSYDSQGRRYSNIERENLQEKRRLTDAYEAALAKAHDTNQEQEKVYESKLDNAMSAANERTANQIKTQKSEFTQMAEDKREEAELAKKYYAAEIAREKNKAIKGTEQIVKENDINREKAIAERSQKYNEYIAESSKINKYNLSEKEKELNALKNTDDPNKISPGARSKIEEAYRQRFSQDLNEERRVNAANTAALKTQNSNFQQNIKDGYADRFNDMSKDLRERHMVEKQQLVHGYNDLEAFSEETKKNLQDRQVDLSQRNYQKHTHEMSLLEKRNSENLKEQRASLAEIRYKDKDDLETKQRNQEREFRFKLTDTQRDYEKKIVDQHDLHEREMSQAKFEFDKKLQDQDRAAKRLLNDRIQAYEAQLNQQESSHKEQSRLLTEHFQEELDTMKRTNARITQSKS